MLRRSITLLLVVFSISAQAQSGKPYSGVRDNADGTQTFDLAVSLHHAALTDDQKDDYKEVFYHMADAIYEATNDGHYIGMVRIFMNGKQAGNSDIIWRAVSPSYATLGGINSRYGKIRIGDKETDASPNMLSSAEGRQKLGYILAHEFAHYAYSIYDQYKSDNPEHGDDLPAEFPRFSDDEDNYGLMVHPENAFNENYQWLNFDHGMANKNNAHYRVWETSSWGLLTMPEFINPSFDRVRIRPTRITYSALATRAPSNTDEYTCQNGDVINYMKVELPTTDSRSKIDFEWLEEEDIELVMVLDRSGSMDNDDAMLDVRKASTNFLDILPAGRTTFGIVSYDNHIVEEYPLTPIPDPAGSVVDNAKSIIDTLSPRGQTHLYSAADYGLDLLNTYRTGNGTNAIRFVMLLSDGRDNERPPRDRGAVADNFINDNVPLFSFGYGRAGDYHDPLTFLAENTRGRYYPNVTESEQLLEVFKTALSIAAGVQYVPIVWDPNGGANFLVDNTMNKLEIVVNYIVNDGFSDVDFTVRDKDDNVVQDLNVVKEVSAGVFPASGVATITIDETDFAAHAASLGNWSLDYTITGNASVREANTSAYLESSQETMELIVDNNSFHVTYPEPILLTSTVTMGPNITGLSVSATLTNPDGSTVPVTLYDDGTNGDAYAEDGTYSAYYYNYTQNGEYTLEVIVDNEDGNGMLTQNGSVSSPNSVVSPSLTPFQTPFARTQTISFAVTDVVMDDHGNDIHSATSMPINNSPIAGKIELAGDVDYFSIDATGNTDDILIRIADMSSLFAPEITVTDQSGAIIAYSNINVGSTTNGYLMVRIPAVLAQDMLYVAVNDLDQQKSNEIYKISAGAEKVGDEAVGSPVKVLVKDEGLHEHNIVKPRVVVKNNGEDTLNGFTVCYYLTSENGKTPIVENYYSPHSTITLENLGNDNYRVVLAYNGIVLEPGASLPDDVGSVIGIRYGDWGVMDKSNDYSNPGTADYVETNRIAIFSGDGVLISGSFPLDQ